MEKLSKEQESIIFEGFDNSDTNEQFETFLKEKGIIEEEKKDVSGLDCKFFLTNDTSGFKEMTKEEIIEAMNSDDSPKEDNKWGTSQYNMRKALEMYLSAGCKEDRRIASIVAKEALNGEKYIKQ